MRLELRLELPRQRVSTHIFDQHGGFIGSDPECEWVIDAAGYRLARRHALVAFDEEQFWLCDESLDGICHNESPTPIGRGNRVVVNDGDHFRFGSLIVAAHLLRAPSTPHGESNAADLTTANEIPAIPDDWLTAEPGLSGVARREVPAITVSRRLTGMQQSASEALLKALITEGARPALDLEPATATTLGAALRLCIESLLRLGDEVRQLELDLAGAPPLEPPHSPPDAAGLCRRLLAGEGDEALQELKQLCDLPRGALRALKESAEEALSATLALYEPDAVAARFDREWAVRRQERTAITRRDRLLRRGGLWRFYCSWSRQLARPSSQRADRRQFDRQLLIAYRSRRHPEAPVTASVEAEACN